MNMIRRDGRDDTGEQDVQELRRRFSGDEYTLNVTNEPFVRHREDVPHEAALPDFYGLYENDGIDEELHALFEAGELCCGYDDTRGEWVYWLPEPSAPEPAPKPRAHRRRRRLLSPRRLLLAVAASLTPFVVGMVAEASLDDYAHPHPPMNRPDLAADEHSEDVSTTPAPSLGITTYRPTSTSYARHARVPVSPTVEKPNSYVGKHRKKIPAPFPEAHVSPSASSKAESTPKAVSAAAKHASTPSPAATKAPAPKPDDRAKENPVQEVVHNVLSPVKSLLN